MYVCGKNVAREYLNSNEKILGAYLLENYNEQDILSKLRSKTNNIKYVKRNELDRMTRENHQGIILKVEDFNYSDIDVLKQDDALVVILDHIEDPHNFGAIIRTCEAAGVTGIIIPKNRCVEVNATVIRTSVGATKYVPIVMVTNITNTINELKKDGFWIVGTDMDGEDYTKIDYKGKTCIVIGNEGYGMSDLVRKNCDFIATIPMKGQINSLNASVASGVIIYEAVRQREL
jgi:23S rRNA (guanosine2251-2'-O)-methyltransferase